MFLAVKQKKLYLWRRLYLCRRSTIPRWNLQLLIKIVTKPFRLVPRGLNLPGGSDTPQNKILLGIRVASEVSRNEISRNVLRNFYFAFRKIFEWLSRNFAKFRETKCMKISRNLAKRNVWKFRESDLTKLYRNEFCLFTA